MIHKMSPPSLELYTQLSDSSAEDCLHERRNYIPVDVVDDVITKDNVKAELGRKSGKRPNLSGCLANNVIKKDAKKVFAILVYLKEPWSVKKMLNDGFTDEDLPFTKDRKTLCSFRDPAKIFTPPKHWDQQTVDEFINKQWIFLAPVFSTSGEHKTLCQSCLLPFSELEPMKHSRSSVVYKATVHSSHLEGVSMDPRNFQIALKEFKFENDFKQECENLLKIRRLETNNHITQNLATFSQGPKYYIMFPWADGGDLDEFWETNNSKLRTPQLVLWCLQQMLGLSEALQALHREIDPKANCRHGDLKPGNILHFYTDGEGILKIADFGISRIHNEATIAREGKPTTTGATTRSYEAPEAVPEISANGPRSRKYDIWSMGCIFLEFTVWLVLGLEDIKLFSDSRKAEPTGEKSYAQFYEIANRKAQVHPKVFQRISDLKMDRKSKEGTALGDLLDLIKTKLLEVEVNIRLDAAELCSRLRSIVHRAESNPVYLFNG